MELRPCEPPPLPETERLLVGEMPGQHFYEEVAEDMARRLFLRDVGIDRVQVEQVVFRDAESHDPLRCVAVKLRPRLSHLSVVPAWNLCEENGGEAGKILKSLRKSERRRKNNTSFTDFDGFKRKAPMKTRAPRQKKAHKAGTKGKAG